jgi:hypothetical protein
LLWLAFFSDARVHVAKLTHIWRGQGEQELDEDGVPITRISQMTGHALDNGKKVMVPQSCSHNPTYPTHQLMQLLGVQEIIGEILVNIVHHAKWLLSVTS